MAHAIIRTGGKQFLVAPGKTVRVPSLAAAKGSAVELEALLMADDSVEAGNSGKVSATVVGHGRAPKIIVFKKKRRKHYKRKQGHRQGYTMLRIDSIG